MAKQGEITLEQAETVRAALRRLCEQPQFVNSPAMMEMLRFIVESTLVGDGENLKAYTIATKAMGRPPSFDPQADPIVRVTATRLRRALEAYAQGPGKEDPVSIVLERGSYVPQFAWRAAPAPTVLEDEPAGEIADNEAPPSAAAAGPPPAMPRPRLGARFAMAVLALSAGGVGIALIAFSFLTGARMTPVPAGFTEAPEKVAISGPSPMVEFRPLMILGKLDQLDSNPGMELQGRRLRALLLSELRPFDDILDVKDDPGYTRGAQTTGTPELTYLLEGSMVTRLEITTFTTNLVNLATGLSIYTTVFEGALQSESGNERLNRRLRDFAVKLAQPYGIVSSNAWSSIVKTPELQGVYACQLRVFQYWQTYTRENYDEALGCLRQRLAAEPASSAALANLAFLYVEAVRAHYHLSGEELSTVEDLREQALKVANRAVQAAPNSARAHSAMAAAYMINRNFAASVEQANEALTLNPMDPELRSDLGAKLIQMGRYKDGLAMLEPVLSLGGAQPPWRVIFAALGSYMAGEAGELEKLAVMLKKEDGALPLIIQLLDAIKRGDQAEQEHCKAALSKTAPGGPRQIMGLLADRIYNPEILQRISIDISKIYSN